MRLAEKMGKQRRSIGRDSRHKRGLYFRPLASFDIEWTSIYISTYNRILWFYVCENRTEDSNIVPVIFDVYLLALFKYVTSLNMNFSRKINWKALWTQSSRSSSNISIYLIYSRKINSHHRSSFWLYVSISTFNLILDHRRTKNQGILEFWA